MPVQVELVGSSSETGEYPEYQVVEVSETEFDVNIVELDAKTESPSVELNEEPDLDTSSIVEHAESESLDAEEQIGSETENENTVAEDLSAKEVVCAFDDEVYKLAGMAPTTTLYELFAHIRASIPLLPVKDELVIQFKPSELTIEESSLDSRTHALDDIYMALDCLKMAETEFVCDVSIRKSFRETISALRESRDRLKRLSEHENRNHKRHHKHNTDHNDAKRSKH